MHALSMETVKGRVYRKFLTYLKNSCGQQYIPQQKSPLLQSSWDVHTFTWKKYF